ncbi:MAG TPA: WD40 repeat domain-containing protein [Deinococcales bacterium]|nr:WD40 repeat domain-containing protein [Deinococcales bacterium]
MPLPLIFLVMAMGGGAAIKGAQGGSSIVGAKDVLSRAEARRKAAETRLEHRLLEARAALQALDTDRAEVRATVLQRFLDLVERQKKRGHLSDQVLESDFNVTPSQIEDVKTMGSAGLQIAQGVAKAGAAGVGVGVGTVSAVTAFGAASTGTAIGSLSGAAANSALLAWLGGGSLASGGGGMALGSVVLGGLFAAPAALVGSLILAKKGAEAKTAAIDYAAKVDVFAADVRAKCVLLGGLRRRAEEVRYVLDELGQRANAALAVCEAGERADPNGRVVVEHFFTASQFVMTLGQVCRVPIIDEHLQATAASQAVIQATGLRLPELPGGPSDASGSEAWGEGTVGVTTFPVGSVKALAFDPAGILAYAGEAGEVTLVNASGEQRTLTGRKGTVNDLAFGAGGRRLASAGEDKLVRVWDVAADTIRQRLGHEERYARAVAFLDLVLAAGFADGTVCVWDLRAGKSLFTRQVFKAAITRLAFDPKGRWLLVSGEDAVVRMIDRQTGVDRRALAGHNGPVRSLQVSPDGTRVVTASDDKTVRLWDLSTGEQLLSLGWRDRYARDASLAPDGRVLAAGFADGTVLIADATSGDVLQELSIGSTSVERLSFTPDGESLIVAAANGLHLVAIEDATDADGGATVDA